jgi:hypothetical protein
MVLETSILAASRISDAGYTRSRPCNGSARRFSRRKKAHVRERTFFYALGPGTLHSHPGTCPGRTAGRGLSFPFEHRAGARPMAHDDPDRPFAETCKAHCRSIRPDDASKLGLNADGFARVSTAHGSAVLRVKITAAQVPGRTFAPRLDGRAGARWRGCASHHRPSFRAAGLQGGAGPGFLRRARFCSFARAPLSGDTVFAWNAIEGGYAARFATNEPFAGLFEALAARSPGAGRQPTTIGHEEFFARR